MNAFVFVEGGGDSKDTKARCREAFSKLLGACGLRGRMPRIVACGGRQATFHDFCTAHNRGGTSFVALLVDSEDPVSDFEKPWQHLQSRDSWSRPGGASDDQALLMATSMETWIAADSNAIRLRFGARAKLSKLPPRHAIEARSRQSILESLKSATTNCDQVYEKGAVAFTTLAFVSPDAIADLKSFARVRRVLRERLAGP